MNCLKIVVVGDTMVGKSSIMITYEEKHFPGETTRMSYLYLVYDNVVINMNVDDKYYKLTVWDTSGQDSYEKLRPLSYRETDCFVICYSIESRESFDNVLSKWYPEVHNYMPRAAIVLVGTKSDLRELNAEKYVTTEEANELKTKIGAYGAMECSAKNQENLKEIFVEAFHAVESNQVEKKCFCCQLF